MIKFHCKYEESQAMHLSQFFKGLKMLSQKGIVDINRTFTDSDNAVVRILVNDTIRVIVDANDGISHIDGSKEDKIADFFRVNKDADIIFKRGYVDEMKNYDSRIKVYPLGLNYMVDYDANQKAHIKKRLKNFIKDIDILRSLLKADKFSYSFDFYEQLPIFYEQSKILFLARLWNPEKALYPSMKEEWEQINHNRVEAIRLCRKEFGNIFLGGVEDNEFSQKYAKDVIMDYKFTNKASYLELMKQHNICIATTGLHGSIGWKFAEYIAASRCVVSEPLEYGTIGDFQEGKNYLSYKNPIEMVEKINSLLENKQKMRDMMYANYQYYNNFMRPDNLVLNALMEVQREFF